MTIGKDPEIAAALESKGAKHVECAVDDIVVDKKNRIVSTPAYMLAESLLDAEAGINKLVTKVFEMA